MLAPLSRSAGLEDQLQLDDEVNSEIADGYTVGSSARHRTAVGDLPTSSVSALQLVLRTLGSERTPPVLRGVCLFPQVPLIFCLNKLLSQMYIYKLPWKAFI